MRLPLSALSAWMAPVPPADEVARTLTAIGLEVEGREDGPTGVVLEINVTPNRGDCLSVRGLARELCAALERPFADPAPAPLPSALANSSLSISLPDPRCPRYLGVEIRGVKNGQSPKAAQQLLEAFGVRPISLLVDAANLVMLELGQPLHTFDLATLKGGITVRAARAGESMTTLDGQKRELTPWPVKGQPFAPLLICDSEAGARPIALAGVMGGGETEISDRSVDLYLEAATFDPVAVRRTAKKFLLHSEASHRFERSVDPNLPKLAAERFIALVQEWGGGGAVAGWRLAETAAPQKRTVELRPSQLRRLLGAELPAGFVATRFAALGFKSAGGERWEIPGWRTDLAIEEDLIEEAGRHYGYDRIGETLPAGIDPKPGRSASQLSMEAWRQRAIGQGFTELISIPFAKPQGAPNALAIANPIWLDHPELTADLAAALLPALNLNLRPETRGAEPHRVRLCEFRKSYTMGADGARREEMKLLLAMAWPVKTPLQQIALELRDQALAVIIPERPAVCRQTAATNGVLRFELTLLAPEAPVATLTLIPSQSLPDFDRARLFYIGLVEAPLLELLPPGTARPPDRFPAIERDLNFIVPDAIQYRQIKAAARDSGAQWLEMVNNLDRGFTGASIPAGHRALAVRFTFRNPDDTLTAEAAEADLAKIRAALAALGVTVRA